MEVHCVRSCWNYSNRGGFGENESRKRKLSRVLPIVRRRDGVTPTVGRRGRGLHVVVLDVGVPTSSSCCACRDPRNRSPRPRPVPEVPLRRARRRTLRNVWPSARSALECGEQVLDVARHLVGSHAHLDPVGEVGVLAETAAEADVQRFHGFAVLAGLHSSKTDVGDLGLGTGGGTAREVDVEVLDARRHRDVLLEPACVADPAGSSSRRWRANRTRCPCRRWSRA